jgi:hypothetical protein
MKTTHSFTKFPPVEIIWNDAYSKNGWKCDQDIREMAQRGIVCKSVGYLVRESKKYMVLAHGLSEDNNFQDLFSIPKGCIRSVRKIK